MDNKNILTEWDFENIFETIKKIEDKIGVFKEKLKKWDVEENNDIKELTKFLNDYKQGLQFLLTHRKSILVEYMVKIYNKNVCLSEFFDEYKYIIHSLIYNENEYGFYKFEDQLRNNIRDIFRYLKNEFKVFQEEDKILFESILKLPLKDLIAPEAIMLKNGNKLDVFNTRETNNKNLSVQNSTKERTNVNGKLIGYDVIQVSDNDYIADTKTTIYVNNSIFYKNYEIEIIVKNIETKERESYAGRWKLLILTAEDNQTYSTFDENIINFIENNISLNDKVCITYKEVEKYTMFSKNIYKNILSIRKI